MQKMRDKTSHALAPVPIAAVLDGDPAEAFTTNPANAVTTALSD